MKHPLVSVIVPNFNHAPFLRERLDSILHQNYDRFEVIILDDCSTDESKQVIADYEQNEHVCQVVLNDRNSGSPFRQWDRGFSLCRGDLVWIAESDDSCEPDFLSHLVAAFERDEQIVVAFCRSVKIDTSGRPLGEEGLKNDFVMSGPDFIRSFLGRFNYIVNASSAVFSRAVLASLDRSYTEFRGCGDWIFWTEIARHGCVAYINEPLNYFRQHDSNTTANQTRTGKGALEVAAVVHYFYRKHYIGLFSLFRSQVVHVYSFRYGKSRGVVSDDIRQNIIAAWGGGVLVNIAVSLLGLLNKLGIHLINH